MIYRCDPDQPLTEASFAVFDVETTGLSPAYGDRVCEVACVRLTGGVEVERFVTLVDPGRPLSPGAAAVNGITAEMLSGAGLSLTATGTEGENSALIQVRMGSGSSPEQEAAVIDQLRARLDGIQGLSFELRRTTFRPRVFQAAWVTGAIFLALLAANRWIVRWWCRAICPLGALLGWIARVAVYRIDVDPDLCTRCNRCAADCQGADEPFSKHRVSECHVCLNCVAACPEGAIAFRPFVPSALPSGGVDLQRRQVVGAALAGAALLPLARASSGSASSPRAWKCRNSSPSCMRASATKARDSFSARPCPLWNSRANAAPAPPAVPMITSSTATWSPLNSRTT